MILNENNFTLSASSRIGTEYTIVAIMNCWFHGISGSLHYKHIPIKFSHSIHMNPSLFFYFFTLSKIATRSF